MSMTLLLSNAPLAIEDEQVRRITAALQRQLSGRVRDLSLAWSEDRMVLRGRVLTYYTKQLAQSIVLELADAAPLVNEIQVV